MIKACLTNGFLFISFHIIPLAHSSSQDWRYLSNCNWTLRQGWFRFLHESPVVRSSHSSVSVDFFPRIGFLIISECATRQTKTMENVYHPSCTDVATTKRTRTFTVESISLILWKFRLILLCRSRKIQNRKPKFNLVEI